MSHHHDHDIQAHSAGTSAKTLTAYVTGLVLCILLTLVAFAAVEYRFVDGAALYIGLSVLAIAQLIVQVVCFLRLNASPEGQWNLMPFLMAILIIVILVGGSLWIMYNLNANMV